MKIHILVEAEDEIEAARRYLNQQSPELGCRLLSDPANTLAEVADRPLRFGQLETLPDSHIGARC